MAKKHFNNLIEQIANFDNLLLAFSKTQKSSKKYKISSIKFQQNLIVNLEQLQQDLLKGTYTPGQYHKFYVYEPKKRLIYAPAFRDKIVHHAINLILKKVFNPTFINTTYACIEGRGCYAAVEKLKHYVSTSSKTDWVVKLDITKFFYSLDHSVLKKELRRKISCIKTLVLLDKIIDSSPTNPGLPLGNLTSQLFANIYMNKIDQFVKRNLRIKKYIRYSDDMLILVNSKSRAKEVLNLITNQVNLLNLSLNNKTKIFPITQGISALGVRVSHNYVLLSKRSLKKIKKFMRHRYLVSDKYVKVWLASWKGHTKSVNYRIEGFK